MSKPVSLTLSSNQTNSSTNWTLDSSSNDLVFSCTDSNKSIDLGNNVLAPTFTGDLIGNADTATKIASIETSDIVTLDATQQLKNKTFVSPELNGEITLTGGFTFTGDLNSTNLIVCNQMNVKTSGKIFFLNLDTDNSSGMYIQGTIGNRTAIDFYVNNHRILANEIDILGNPLVDISGSLNVSGSTTNNSDDRLKHNEIDITNGLEIINKLKPQIYDKTFTIIDENNNNEEIEAPTYKESGFIAQEVNEINELKHLVSISENTDSGIYRLNYIGIIPYNTAAIKELDQIVKQRAAMITALETRMASLEARLAT